MTRAEAQEILRGTDVIIDTVFIRHAQREAMTQEMLVARRSPQLTAEGILKAKEWGAQILQSAKFFDGNYDQIVFTGSVIPRTHQTAEAIREGAGLDNQSSRVLFPIERGSMYNRILRERPDGTPWNDNKIKAAARNVLSEDSKFSRQIAEACANSHGKADPTTVIEGALKILNSDNSTLGTFLLTYFSPEIAIRLSRDIVGALFDGFMDEEEVKLYMGNPMGFLSNLSHEVLKRRPSNTKFLHVGVTHDFNIAGMLKGMCGINSFSEVGGAPGYLSYLHIRMELDSKGKKVIKVLYNGEELELKPEIKDFLIDGKNY